MIELDLKLVVVWSKFIFLFSESARDRFVDDPVSLKLMSANLKVSLANGAIQMFPGIQEEGYDIMMSGLINGCVAASRLCPSSCFSIKHAHILLTFIHVILLWGKTRY
ncbi:hypothetical protein Droror1_Dr00021502 [Drosera rotundifolia]